MRKALTSMVLCLSAMTPVLVAAKGQNVHSYIPTQGFVRNEEVAIAVAEAIVIGVYGRERIESEKPFIASLDRGVWTVSGTMSERRPGGVFVIRINQKDSKVVSLTHGK